MMTSTYPEALIYKEEAQAAQQEKKPGPVERLVSLDAFRGLVMVLMVSAGLRITTMVDSQEWKSLKTPMWEKVAQQTDHVAWTGCVLWDMIQPSFMFMVGAALAMSVANRKAKGHSFGRMLGHAIFRSVALVLLSVFLISYGQHTNWLFTNVLAQIGLGYTFLFLIAWLKPRWQFLAAIVILAGYWGAFALYPAPTPSQDLSGVGLKADWPRQQGFAAHWEKNTNLAARADQWLLNRLPQYDRSGKRTTFVYEPGGYQTLNFVPSLATMIFGLLAGGLIRSRVSAGWKLGAMLAAGIAGVAAGWVLGYLGICPIVKRIWTPSWALYSGGIAFMALAVFYLIIDVIRIKFWAMPLVVVGMNSIAIYCMSMMLKPVVRENITRHLGSDIFRRVGGHYAMMVDAGVFLLFCWLVCWWMYHRKMFIRI